LAWASIPADGRTCANRFSDWLPEGDGPRLHHREGASEGLRFLFLDTRELLGHYMEYTWMSDTAWQRIGGRWRRP
jgi:hypothetical protein